MTVLAVEAARNAVSREAGEDDPKLNLNGCVTERSAFNDSTKSIFKLPKETVEEEKSKTMANI